MKKVSMQIVDIEKQTNRNGIVILSIKAKSEDQIYTFAAKEDDYLDDRIRKGFHQDWLNTIKKAQTLNHLPKKDKDEKTKNVKALVGEEVEESVY
jgi:hypothetical protein